MRALLHGVESVPGTPHWKGVGAGVGGAGVGTDVGGAGVGGALGCVWYWNCGHRRQPPAWTMKSEDHVMVSVGTIPAGSVAPL